MNDLFQEFQRRISAQQMDKRGADIELLLSLLPPTETALLRLCAIPLHFDAKIIQVLDPSIDSARAEKYFQKFSCLSVTMPFEDMNQLVLQDNARKYLFAQWLLPDKSAKFSAASVRLAEYFQRQLTQSSSQDHCTVMYNWIFHHIGSDIQLGFNDLERLIRTARNSFNLAESQDLIKLVRQYQPIFTQQLHGRLEYQQAKLYSDRCQWSAAEKLFKYILEHFKDDLNLTAKTYNRLGMIHAQQRKWKTSIDFHTKALDVIETNSDGTLRDYHIMHDLGVVYRDSGDLKHAKVFLQKSIGLASSSKDNNCMGAVHNSLGTLHYNHGAIRHATNEYKLSLKYLQETSSNFNLAHVYNNLGIAYADQQKWEESEAAFDKSLQIKCEAQDFLGQAYTLNNLVRVYLNLQLYDKAIVTSQKAIRIFTDMHTSYNAAMATRNLARLYCNNKIRSTLEPHRLETPLPRNSAKLYRHMNIRILSQQFYLKAVELFVESNDMQMAEETLIEAARKTGSR